MDLGSGCGSASVAAIQCGAASVVANDVCPWAGTAAMLNAQANGVDRARLVIEGGDLIGGNVAAAAATSADVVLVGDMLYDSDIGARVWRFCLAQRGRGARVFVGDPGRHVLPELSGVERLVQRESFTHESLRDGGEAVDDGAAASLVFQSGLTTATVYEVT